MFKRSYLYTLTLLTLSVLLSSAKVRAQNNWILASNHEGIMIYTRAMQNSKVKAVKVVCNLPATPTQLVAAILDIETCNQWVYHSKKNVLLKTISPLDIIYYAEVDVPWPAENRDYVVHIQITQNPQSKVIAINSPCISGYVAEKPGIVRISNSIGKWTIVPAGKNQVKAEYTLEVDPMGDIPAWLTNLFATKGPLETFRKLKTHVQKDAYKKARFAELVN